MQTSDFNYDLPKELIAQEPSLKRDMSRLMVLHRKEGTLEHRIFKDIVEYFNPGDVLVLNNSRVIPARLYGRRPGKEEKIEVFLAEPLVNGAWKVMVKPGKKARVNTELIFGESLNGIVTEVHQDGTRIVKFDWQGDFYEVLNEIGNVPLPPYITHRLEDKERYQTVYSDPKGSVAAPTAGLHFTPELLEAIRRKGVAIVYITLHVGMGTFLPVKEREIHLHKMHSEVFHISPETANLINGVKSKGGRIISVGTTTTRTLESASDESGVLKSGMGKTDIFIYPGYKFKTVDVQLTNFHLPESTLMMLVSAFYSREEILRAYQCAIDNKYRFFSFGDAMLII